MLYDDPSLPKAERTWYTNVSCSGLPGLLSAAAPRASSSSAEAVSAALRPARAAPSGPARVSVNCTHGPYFVWGLGHDSMSSRDDEAIAVASRCSCGHLSEGVWSCCAVERCDFPVQVCLQDLLPQQDGDAQLRVTLILLNVRNLHGRMLECARARALDCHLKPLRHGGHHVVVRGVAGLHEAVVLQQLVVALLAVRYERLLTLSARISGSGYMRKTKCL